MENLSSNKPTNLFWTGGWDSTFRLLEALLIERVVVKPFYIIDPNRKSISNEIKAIFDIKHAICSKYKYAKDLLGPINICELGCIKSDKSITSAYKSVKERYSLGSQYDWLARFCQQNEIFDMEIGLIRDGHIYNILKPNLNIMNQYQNPSLKYDTSYENSPEYILFKYYKFPLFYKTKLDMYNLTIERSWMDIMVKTWFCLKPVFGKIPCGTCNPCKITIEQGLEWRIPFYRRNPTLRRMMSFFTKLLSIN